MSKEEMQEAHKEFGLELYENSRKDFYKYAKLLRTDEDEAAVWFKTWLVENDRL